VAERWPVLLMVRELGLGGSERQTSLMAASLDRSRFVPYVGCFRSAGIRRRELDEAGVPVVEFPVTSFRSLSAWRGGRELLEFLEDRGIALVHAFDYPTALFAAAVARFRRRTRMVSSQRSHRELTPGWTRWALRMSDHMVDRVVVNCDFVRRHLIEEEKVPADRVRLCYNGVDTDQFHPGARERPPALRDASVVVGVVCALRPEKDLPTLLRGFARARRARSGARLLLVGDGAAEGELRAVAAGLEIAAHCSFVPATPDVGAWLRAIDVFVLPSRTEALSNSLMEAMASGCCVVASRVGGNPELVRDGATGLLFEQGDAAGLARQIGRLIDDPALRERLAGTAADFVRENFSARISALRMAEIYGELIERRSG
jgi:glycosyltransferase involved in cell wall biosynthesis